MLSTAHPLRPFHLPAFVLAITAASPTPGNGQTAPPNPVVINEIHYDPSDGRPAEFVELHNRGDSSVDLSGWQFTEGIGFTFPEVVLEAGGFIVVARAPSLVTSDFGVAALGPWEGKLDNEGETIVLRDAAGVKIDEVDHGVGFPWPTAAQGGSPSMELVDPRLDNDLGGSWRSATRGFSGPQVTYINAAQDTWRYHKGDTEPATDSSGRRWTGADFDGDGLAALLEHALGTSDLSQNALAASVSVSADGGLHVSFRRDPTAEDTDLSVEYSTDLESWRTANPDGRISVSYPPEGQSVETWAVEEPGAVSLFIRLRATLR